MNTVDAYIAQFEPEIQSRLNILRQLFFDIIPETNESIRYNMPAYKTGQYHLYFAGYKKHIGFYPVYGLTEIEEELIHYRAKGTKDSLHFPHNKPLPIDLIKKIILLRSQKTNDNPASK